MSNFLLNMAALTHSVPLGSLRDCSALAASRSPPPRLSLFALCGWKEIFLIFFFFVPPLVPFIFPSLV